MAAARPITDSPNPTATAAVGHRDAAWVFSAPTRSAETAAEVGTSWPDGRHRARNGSVDGRGSASSFVMPPVLAFRHVVMHRHRGPKWTTPRAETALRSILAAHRVMVIALGGVICVAPVVSVPRTQRGVSIGDLAGQLRPGLSQPVVDPFGQKHRHPHARRRGDQRTWGPLGQPVERDYEPACWPSQPWPAFVRLPLG
jgi:hypothetical protein